MKLPEEQLLELRAAVKPDSYDGSVSARAQLVLWYYEGRRKTDITKMSGTTRPTIDKWIGRYEQYGLAGLANRISPGAPRTIPARIRGRVLALTRQTPPAELGISHWSAAKMAAWIKKTEGVSVSQPWVSRLWREHGLQPWRQGTFKISKDPEFEEKVRDVTDLYLNPPEGEAVVSVDVKTGIQALDRTQPLLPVGFGKSEKRTHDYKRNGTTDMYAGFDIVTGTVTDLRQALIRSWARPGVSRQAADVEIPAIQRTRKRVRPMRPRGCRAGPRAAGTAAGTPCEPGSRHPDEVGK